VIRGFRFLMGMCAYTPIGLRPKEWGKQMRQEHFLNPQCAAARGKTLRRRIRRSPSRKKKGENAVLVSDPALASSSLNESGQDDCNRGHRYYRRWFPRWFDGIELGVHSLSIVDTLHKFTGEGIPKIKAAQCWPEYKSLFAKIVKETSHKAEDNCLYRGTTTPLMTGTKGNQTQLIFGELELAQEVFESVDLTKRIEEMCFRSEHLGKSVSASKASEPLKCPSIVFDVFIDSKYSRSKPTTPDYRVVHMNSCSILKINDLMKLTLQAGDATLLIAHTVDGKVRVRQAMTFSIPRYN